MRVIPLIDAAPLFGADLSGHAETDAAIRDAATGRVTSRSSARRSAVTSGSWARRSRQGDLQATGPRVDLGRVL